MRGIVMGGLLTLAAAACAGQCAAADQNWCSASQAVPVARFAFPARPRCRPTPTACARASARRGGFERQRRRPRRRRSGCDVQHCGQFDDDYSAARRWPTTAAAPTPGPGRQASVADWGHRGGGGRHAASYNGASHHRLPRGGRLVGQCALRGCNRAPAGARPTERLSRGRAGVTRRAGDRCRRAGRRARRPQAALGSTK